MSWIDDAPTEHLMCRDTGLRHKWEPVSAERDPQGFVEIIECQRCTSFKKRYLTRTGKPRKAKYEYVEGFLRKGEGRATKMENAAIRMAAFRRRYDV